MGFTSRTAGGWPSRLKLLAEMDTAVPGVYSGRNPFPQSARARAVFPTPLSPRTKTLNSAEGGRPATVHTSPSMRPIRFVSFHFTHKARDEPPMSKSDGDMNAGMVNNNRVVELPTQQTKAWLA